MQSKVGESEVKRKLKSYIPIELQKILYKFLQKIRLVKNMIGNAYTKDDLKKYLAKAGLRKNDVVIVHSSLSRIGYVKGGADALIDSFLEIIGQDGLLIMPAFCAPEYDKKRKLYLFNTNKTPINTGAVPETFRLRSGVRRSLSPTHSLAAYGKKADWFVSGHENCDNPFSMKGPFGKLYSLNAKIFFVGVDQRANPSIHIVEDKCKFPFEVFTKKFKVLVTDENKNEKIIYARRHLSHLYKIRNNNMVEKYLLQDNLMKIYPFGDTELRVVRVKDLVDVMEKLLKKGITIYNS